MLIFLFLLFGIIIFTTFRNSSGCSTTYIVQSGDTLSAIAQTCKVSLAALQAANPQLQPPYQLVTGQVITIPELISTDEGTPAAPTIVSAGIPVTGSQGKLVLNPQSGVAGTQVSVASAGFPTTSTFDLTLSPQGQTPTSTFHITTDINGTFAETVTIPGYALVGSIWQIAVLNPSGAGVMAAAQFQVASSAIVGNPPESPTVQNPPAASPSSPGVYVVQPGDTLGGIATSNGTSVEALLAANPSITDPNAIVPGQQIVIPGTGASPEPSTKGGQSADSNNPPTAIPPTAVPPTSVPPTAVPQPGPKGSLTLQPATGNAGSQVAIIGSGFGPNAGVTVSVGQGANITARQSVTAGASGGFQTRLTIPADALPGSVWTITVVPAGGPAVSVQFQVSAQTPSGLYTVRGGDTMNGIASRFQTTGDAIIRANADIGPSSLLHTGQQLYIPGTTVGIDGRSIYIVKAGDTLLRIARERNTSLAAIFQTNPGLTETTILFPGDHVVLP